MDVVPALLLPVGCEVNSVKSEFFKNHISSRGVRLVSTSSNGLEVVALFSSLESNVEPLLVLPFFLSSCLKAFELRDAVSEGFRSACFLDEVHNLRLSFLGLEDGVSQEFVLNAKGVGCFDDGPEGVISRDCDSFKRPFGGCDFSCASKSVEMCKALIKLNRELKLGIKFAPTIFAVKLPDNVNSVISGSGFSGTFGVELRLMPSQVRVRDVHNFKFLREKDLVVESVWKDFLSFLEVVPKTARIDGVLLEWLLIGNNNDSIRLSKDLVLNELGAWFVDFESVVFKLQSVEDAVEMQGEYFKQVVYCFTFLLHNLTGLGANDIMAVCPKVLNSEFVCCSFDGKLFALKVNVPAAGKVIEVAFAVAECSEKSKRLLTCL